VVPVLHARSVAVGVIVIVTMFSPQCVYVNIQMPEQYDT
jgi:hypothetical protein